jgi:hypothetical protein
MRALQIVTLIVPHNLILQRPYSSFLHVTECLERVNRPILMATALGHKE